MCFGGELNKDLEYYAHHRENTQRWFKWDKRTTTYVFTLSVVIPTLTYFWVKDVQVRSFVLVSAKTSRSKKIE